MHTIYRKHAPRLPRAFRQPKFRWVLWIFGAFASVLLLIVVLNAINANKTKAAWFDDSFLYRQKIEVTNSGSNQTDFQVAITLDTATLISASKMQSDCDDIRITDISGVVLPHWIEQDTPGCNNSATKIWTKVPSAPTSGATIYLYYGNAAAPNAENGRDTFMFFDDFSTAALSSVWTPESVYSAGTYSITQSGGKLTLSTGTPSSGADIRSANAVSDSLTSFIVEQKLNVTGSTLTNIRNRNYLLQTQSGGTGRPTVGNHDYGLFSTATGPQPDVYWNGYQAITVSTTDELKLTQTLDGTNFSWSVYDLTTSSSVYSNSGAQTSKDYPFLRVAATHDAGSSGVTSMSIDWIIVRKQAASPPTAGAPSGEERSPGPSNYWKMDEGTDNTCVGGTNDVCNASGNSSLDGSINGAPVWQTEDQCISGKCLFFDGVDDSVSVLDNDLVEAGNNFSVGAWFTNYDSDTTAERYIAGKYNSANSTWLLGKKVNANGDFGFQVRTAAGVIASALVPSQQYNDGRWHYAMGVKSGTTVYLYVDGVSVASGSNGSLTTTTGSADMYIGSHDGTIPWKGKIDELKTYKYARSADQVKTDYIRGAANGGSAAVFGAEDTSYLNNGLVGYWKMEEASGASRTDASGNGNTLSDHNTVSSSVGKFGTAGTFVNSSHQYLSIADNTTVGTGNVDFTWSGWVNLSSKSDIRCIVEKANTNQLEYQVYYELASDRFAVLTSSNGVSWDGDAIATNAGSPSINTWYFIVAWYDNTNKTVNIQVNNGTPNSSAAPGARHGTADLTVGTNGNFGTGVYDMDGKIDDLRFYKRLLSESERSRLYAWAPPPIAYYNFDEGTGATLIDRSGSGLNGTLNNGPLWVPGKYGGGLNFSGTVDQNVTVAGFGNSMPTDEITVEFWIKADAISGSQQEAFWLGSDTPDRINIHYNWNPTMYWDFGTCCSPRVSLTTGVAVNTWHHFSYTSSTQNNRMRIYQDGVIIGSNTSPGTFTPANYTLYLGTLADGTSPLRGTMDEVRVYNYERTQKQIVQDMNAGHPAGGSPVGSMIGHWKMDEGSDNTCTGGSNDACNAGFGGSTYDALANNMSSPAASASGWTNNGKVNKAMEFDGVNDYLSTSLLVSPADIAEVTFSAWVRPRENQTNWTAIIAADNGGYDRSFGVRNANFEIQVGNQPWQPGPTIDVGVWQHVAVVYSANQISFYKNGVRYDYGSGGTFGSSNQAVQIGEDSACGSCYWKGTIDEAKVYNYALTPADIAIDYNAGASANFGTGSITKASTLQDANGNSPAGYWNLDENTGITANDSSGNSNTGTLTLGPTWGTGKVNSGVVFDGNNDHILVNDSPSLDLTGDFTLSAWVKRTGGTGQQIVSKTNGGTTGGYALLIGNSGEIYCRTSSGSGAVDSFTAGGYLAANTGWKFITAVRSGTGCRVYVDGVDKTTNFGTHTTMTANALNLTIGTRPDTGGEFWTGTIDEVKVYPYARSQAQISFDYNSGPPLAYWNLEEGKGISTVFDSSGNGNTGTMNGFNHFAWGPGKNGSGLIFNGAQYVQATGLMGSPATVTLEAWANPTAYDSSGGEVISIGDHVALRVNSTLVSGFYYNGTSWPGPTVSMTPTNQWHHYVLTINPGASSQKLYVDGLLRNETTFSTAITWAGLGSNTFIGKHGNASGVFDYFGTIDDVKIYNYERTQAQIMDDYNSGAPMAYYKFDECQGLVANNAAGVAGATTATLSGTIVVGSGGTQTAAGTCTSSGAWANNATGKVNSSFGFDGTDDFIGIPDADAIDYAFNQDFGVSAWVKLPTNQVNTVSTDNSIIEKWSGSNGYPYVMRLRNQTHGTTPNKIAVARYDGTNNPGIISTITLNDSQWHHIVFTKNSTVLSLYIDGKLNGTATDTTTGSTLNTSMLYIGQRGGGTNKLTGNVDEARIFNYGLSPTQVQLLYNNNSTAFFGPVTGSP